MNSIRDQHPDLRFSPNEIYLTDEELNAVAQDFFSNTLTHMSHRDRAFLQAALFIAVDKSEQAGLMFSVWKSFVSAAPSQSIKKLLQKLVLAGAKNAYSRYIDDDPKYSAVGKAGVQYSGLATHFRMRVSMGDDTYLPDFTRYGR